MGWRISNIFGHCLIAKLVGQCIGDWHGNCIASAILKIGLDFAPGAVFDAVVAFKFENILVVGAILISDCV